jgi:hypothetical protein
MLETRSDSDPWIQSSKIAKPLRGGNQGFVSGQIIGGGEEGKAFNPLIPKTPTVMKRSSWYISLLKSDK